MNWTRIFRATVASALFLLASYQNCSPVNFTEAQDTNPSLSNSAMGVCGTKVEVNGHCQDFYCKDVHPVTLSTDGVIEIPARDGNGACFAIKLMDRISNAPSESIGSPSPFVIARSHAVTASNPDDTRNAFQMNRKIVDFRLKGIRSLKLAGSSDGTDPIQVDNFVLTGLFPKSIGNPGAQFFRAYGTADSTVRNTGGVLYLDQVVTLQPFAAAGTSTIAPLDITTQVQVGPVFTLDVRALDCGMVGGMSDVYLLFQ